MNPTYQAFLNGTLRSKPQNSDGSFSIENKLEVPIQIGYVTESGQLSALTTCKPRNYKTINQTGPGWYFYVINQYTGSFVSAFECPGDKGYTFKISSRYLLLPNDIGEIPVPNSAALGGSVPPGTNAPLIPSSSPRVLVAASKLPNKNILIRDQFWALQHESFSLAPGETQEASFTVNSGKQDTSSVSADVSASLSADAAGGWGGYSASVSASLSASASFYQQFSISEQSTSYHSKELSNTATNPPTPQTYFLWQLTDVVTVYNPNLQQMASSIITAQQPTIVTGPYPSKTAPVNTQPLPQVDQQDDPNAPCCAN